MRQPGTTILIMTVTTGLRMTDLEITMTMQILSSPKPMRKKARNPRELKKSDKLRKPNQPLSSLLVLTFLA